jgi:endonuclease/exonuclease/phosphatase (EEP) superfamily protein YafD
VIRRVLAAAVVLALAGTLVVLAWPQLLTLQRTAPVAQAISFRAALAGGAVLAAVLGTLLALLVRSGRRFFATVAALLLAFAGLQAAVLASRGFGGPGFEAESETSITVLSWNTLGDAPGVKGITELVLETEPDIVALPETTAATAEEVASSARDAGLPLVAYTVAYDDVSTARSTSLLISSDLGPYVIGEGRSNTSVLPSVVATPTGAGPTIIAAHAVAPLPEYLPEWRSDLAWLAARCQEADVIVAGDFNATLDHFSGLSTGAADVDGDRAFTDLGACRDAARQSQAGAMGTWPTQLPALLGTAIDHVLATPSWRVSGFRVVGDRDGAGSDHRPILAQLTRAG